MMNTKIRTYSELITIPTFIDRYYYLKLDGVVGEETFGSKRYLNQILYRTKRWLIFRNHIIVRDNGCDLGIKGRELYSRITVHHINPITIDDVLNDNPMVFDEDNAITTADITHKAVHYGNEDPLFNDIIIRKQNDTCPWKH